MNKLKFPPIERQDVTCSYLFYDTLSRLHKTASLFPQRDLIGLELKVAMYYLSSTSDTKVRALLSRPAVEPILMILGSRLDLPGLKPLDMLPIASALAGRAIVYRPPMSVAGADNGKVEFENVDPHGWCRDIQAIYATPACALASAAMIFARTIIAHPLGDANGRLARFLVHLTIARAISASVAPVALAPSFYRHRVEIARGLIDLSQSGHWQPFYELFDRVVRSALDDTERLSKDEPNPTSGPGCLVRRVD